MATKKQRRRRAKVKRHEWEYVKTTEDGEEVVLDSPRDDPNEVAAKANGGSSTTPTDARGRPLTPPSLKKVARRGAIFGPLLIVLVFITSPDLSTGAKLLQSLFLIALFLPLSYFLDMMMYRIMTRRAERKAAARRGRR